MGFVSGLFGDADFAFVVGRDPGIFPLPSGNEGHHIGMDGMDDAAGNDAESEEGTGGFSCGVAD